MSGLLQCRRCAGTERHFAYGYDVFVKDDSGSSEWICYDSLEEDASLDERQMFSALDRVVKESGLSYTECCFEQLDGKTVKKEQAL